MKTKTNKKQRQYIDQNPIESLRSIGSSFSGSVVEDLAKDSGKDLVNQLLGLSRTKGGDLHAGEEISFGEVKEKVHEVTEFAHEYQREIIHAERIASHEASQETQVKIQEILIEIKQLAKSSEQLEKQVDVVALEQQGGNPGKYHLNFIESVLEWIRDARANVEDSLVWFQALRSKRSAKQYGSLAKQHGTSFTLSNERSVATQTD